jgi:D-alanyl-D-alanine carboxypeptidase/D-alanyl-D-alanine-endopeptidase (penicillin-binding protein 4)
MSMGKNSYSPEEQTGTSKNTREFEEFSVNQYSNLEAFLAQCRLPGMKKYVVTTSALILLIFWPTLAQDFNASPTPPPVERIHSQFEDHYLKALAKVGKDLDAQGLYVESLDASTILADHQSDVAFNPASVIKIATSFAALDKLGPEYHFETAFEADGEINKKSRTLEGNLILASTGDPLLSTINLNRMILEVSRAGVSKVTGSLIVTGPFTFASYTETPDAIKRLENLLTRQGIRIAKGTRRGPGSGKVLSIYTQKDSLCEIVREQNARSVNQTAERLGEVLGGPTVVQKFLVRGVGIPENEVHVGRTSGLGFNRITPQATVQLLRHLVLWLNFNNLLPQDVLPVAGMDGTLRNRFTTVDYRGSVIGKTGTLPVTDGGVSTLAGFVYTRDRGVLLFAIFNTKGNVNTFRRLQDSLLKDLIAESGGAELSASLHRSSN